MSARPRPGPARRIYRLVYWVFAVGLLSSISLSVTWHVLGPEDGGSAALDPAACARGARRLTHALHAQARALLEEPVPDARLDDAWKTWSVGWHGRMRQLRAHCPARDDREVRQLLDDVERMHLAWSTALNSFAEVGRRPLQRLNASFAEASAD